MNYLAFSSLFIILSCTYLGILLCRHKTTNPSKTPLIYFCFVPICWGIGVYIVASTNNKDIAILGWQIANICTIYVPVIHHHFICNFIGRKSRITLKVCYLWATFLVIVNWLSIDLYLGDLTYMFDQFFYIDWLPSKPPLYMAMYITLYWLLLPYSFILLLKEVKRADPVFHNQLMYILVGNGIAWIGAHSDFLPVFGIYLYPYTNILIGIFPFFIITAIIKHNLLDIKIVIKRSFIYTILATIISIIFLFLIIILENVAQDWLNYRSILIKISTACFLAVILIPFRNQIQNFLDQTFFNGTAFELSEQNQLLREEVVNTEKYKNLSILSSGIAHEIKNPLTALKTFSEYLPKKIDDKEFLLKFAEITENEVQRIDNLVHQLLEYGKPSPLSISKVEIHEVIDETCDIVNQQLINKRIKLEKHYLNSKIYISADKNKIKQALLNIIINSLDALTQNNSLTINTDIINKNIVISIIDTGHGMTEKQVKNALTPFYTNKDSGTGLGLAITDGIINKHNGTLRIKSALNRGTTVLISLPTIT